MYKNIYNLLDTLICNLITPDNIIFHIERIAGVINDSPNREYYIININDYVNHLIHLNEHRTVQILLKHKSINSNIYKEDNNILFEKVKNKKIKIAKVIINNTNVNVNLLNGYRNTILLVAIKENHIELVRALLSLPHIDINLINKNNENALLLSIQYGIPDIAELILAHKNIDIRINLNINNLALALSIKQGYVNISEMLIANKYINVNYNYKNKRLIYLSIKSFNIKITKLLLINKTFEFDGYQLKEYISIQSKTCYDEYKSLFQDSRICVDNALLIALKFNNLVAAKFILNNCKNIKYGIIMIVAAKYGFIEIIKLLVTFKISVENISISLFESLFNNNPEIAEFILLNYKTVNVNYKCRNMYPISFAIKFKYDKIIKLLLLRNDIDVNIEDNNNYTLLMNSVRSLNIELID